MYKVSNQLVPSYISDIMPPLVSDVSNYPLRNSSNYSVPYIRTEGSRRSYVPSSVSLWNNLDETVRNSSTINSFKNNVKSVHIYNVCLLHDFVATLRLSALPSALYFVLSKLAL